MSTKKPKAQPAKIVVERTQTGVRLEKRLLKVLKALAEYLDITLGDLLEGIVLHVFEGKTPFWPTTLERIAQLKDVYGLDLGAEASHRMIDGQSERRGFDAKHIDLRGTVRVAAPAEEALELFTPVGERLWVPGWDPIFLHPAGSEELVEGQVFVTDHGGETTLWDVLQVDREVRTVAYSQCTPGSRMGRVEVRAVEGSETASTFEVRYVLTALTPSANAELESFAAEFDGMTSKWEDLIAAYLQRSPA